MTTGTTSIVIFGFSFFFLGFSSGTLSNWTVSLTDSTFFFGIYYYGGDKKR